MAGHKMRESGARNETQSRENPYRDLHVAKLSRFGALRFKPEWLMPHRRDWRSTVSAIIDRRTVLIQASAPIDPSRGVKVWHSGASA
jgi:hypothetical protein